MDKILVSILVPVYNTSLYLRKCLDSLVAQTLKEVEIICVNDGSTDDSPEILAEYAAKYPHIKVITKENGGLPSARNAGIENAVGEYLGFVDSDDYVEPTMFETMYRAAEKKNSDVVVCGAEIFPNDPAPTQWLIDVLSPRDVHYPEFTTDVLFKERGSRPFIWRNLIRRDLIMRENIRLREDIVLGEDQALQFKVYPKAKGITFISDKLYHYCWYRPGSIMNASMNKKVTQKLEKHVNLCLHVMEEMEKSERCNEMRKELFVWMIELLYDDFIKLSYRDRKRLAAILIPKWNSFGYWAFHNTFVQYINDMFDYFYFIESSPEPADVDASIVVNLYNSKQYFAEFRRSVCEQTVKNVEIIFINNAADNDTYLCLHKWLTSDPRVRVVNQAYAPISDTFNTGLYMAEGRAVLFADTHDFLSDSTALADYLAAMDAEHADAVCSPARVCARERKDFTDYRLYDFMFRREFLADRAIEFGNYHALTTRSFATDVITHTDAIALVEKPLFCYRALWHREWIYTNQANEWLEGFCSMLKMTAEAGMVNEHRRLVDELNSDRVIQLILNATNAYLRPETECPDGENSQGKTFALLCEINRAIVPSFLSVYNSGALKILGEFITRRHSFLSGVMRF